jgi:hypothetical protein
MNENTQLPEIPADEPAQPQAIEENLVVGNVIIRNPTQEGAVAEAPRPPAVEKTGVENSLVVSVSAQQDAEVDESLVFSLAAGRDLVATESLLTNVAVGHDLKFEQGAAGVLNVGGSAQVENSKIGLLVAKSGATLTNSQVLMTTQQAIALGAAFGAVYALLRTLLRGKKKD